MKVSLDHGLTWVVTDGVRVFVSMPEVETEFHLNCTDEGVIVDITNDDEIVGTRAQTYDELIDDIMDEA
jgi:Fe2+ or Zn2+ uptake regulation protein